MNEGERNALWTTWFMPWRDARPHGMTPVGYYTLADLRTAFDAGAAAAVQNGLGQIITRIRQTLDDI